MRNFYDALPVHEQVSSSIKVIDNITEGVRCFRGEINECEGGGRVGMCLYIGAKV